MGSVGADTVKPDPEAVTEVIITAAAPVELILTVCVTGVFTFTLPKLRLVVLSVREGLATSTSTSVLSETPPALAVRTTLWAVETEDAVAWKLAFVAPAATITDAGTVSAALLLVRLTCAPPVPAAALRVTVQE